MDIDPASPPPASHAAAEGFFSSRPLNHPRSISDTGIRASSSSLIPSSGEKSGAPDRLAADFFLNDLSPVANPARARKRLLEAENSPTPGSDSGYTSLRGAGSLFLGSALDDGVQYGDVGSDPALPPIVPPRRPFEKASSTNNLRIARRRGSSTALNSGSLSKRPPLAHTSSNSLSSTVLTSQDPSTMVDRKRHAQAMNGKPKSMRRAYSVVDASVSPLATLAPPARNSILDTEGFFHAKRAECGMVVEQASPVAGFRTQEEKGKALPCFGVKEDGLMRINAETLNRLQDGEFEHNVASYTIIDCRFSYEFEGGHIEGAVNMPNKTDVEKSLFGDHVKLPLSCTSETHAPGGRNILIFHCEFSAKRAPTSACHLRSRDRFHNGNDYPNVYYPEVYILSGGYAEFYKKFPERCDGGYLAMDDPSQNSKRAVDLHAFRQQARPFNRASSFTFGEAQSVSALLKANSRPPLLSRNLTSTSVLSHSSTTITKAKSKGLAPAHFVFPAGDKSISTLEEEGDPDSSFGSTNPGSSPGVGDSPCPANSKIGRHSLKIGREFGERRPMMRAQTSSSLFGR